jgi:hypothetical protein
MRGGQVSRFVGEIPDEILEREVTDDVLAQERRRLTGDDGRSFGARSHAPRSRAAASTLEPGTRRHAAVGRTVYHEKFGRGVVVDAEGQGPEAHFTVRFGTLMKKILGGFLSGGDDGDST